MGAGTTALVSVSLRNTGGSAWEISGSAPVRLLVRWHDASNGTRSQYRIEWLRMSVPPGGGALMNVTLKAPSRAARYRVSFALVRLPNGKYEPPPATSGITSSGADELADLLDHLRQRVAGLVRPDDVLAAAALPAAQRVVDVDAQGKETVHQRAPAADVAALRERLLAIAAREGKTLSAINAGLYAGRLTDQVSARIAQTRQQVATRLIRHYCLAKGVAVALNPIPVADLLAAAGLDAAMVVQLSRVYGLPLTRAESGRLVAVISAQLAALMGAIWGMQLVASALKGMSAGLSVLVTAAAQGALGWYATVLIGRAAERYLVGGKSWGDAGAKRAVADIVASLDRDSILREARGEILKRLKSQRG